MEWAIFSDCDVEKLNFREIEALQWYNVDILCCWFYMGLFIYTVNIVVMFYCWPLVVMLGVHSYAAQLGSWVFTLLFTQKQGDDNNGDHVKKGKIRGSGFFVNLRIIRTSS